LERRGSGFSNTCIKQISLYLDVSPSVAPTSSIEGDSLWKFKTQQTESDGPRRQSRPAKDGGIKKFAAILPWQIDADKPNVLNQSKAAI
jgi:hypothetical protein